MMNSWGDGGFGLPFFGLGMMFFWFLVFIIIGYLVYQDANKHGMNGLLWWILIVIPMIGIVALFLYLILRETGGKKIISEGITPMDILKERYAKGEITSEEFSKMSEDLKI